MSRTGEQLLTALSEFLNDHFTSTTTSAGSADGTTLVDTALGRFGANRLKGRHARLSTTPFAVRRVSENSQASGTVTVAVPFSAQVGSSAAFSLHRYEPALKFRALDAARLEVMDYAFQIVLDDTLTGDGKSAVFDLPSDVVQGPHVAYFERQQAPDVEWNFLQTPHLDALTGWSTSGTVTASLQAVDSADLVIPKYTDRSCTKLAYPTGVAAAGYTQVVANMENGVTAAKAAGRPVTLAMWVYCTTASRVTVSIQHDDATTSSATHKGRGWELLTVEATPPGANTTLLTVRLNISAGDALTIYAQRAWFYYGGKERVLDTLFSEQHPVRARVDDTQRHIMFDETPPRGCQIRIQGKAPLSALGSSAATQSTATMEVDERTAQVVVAKAVQLLLDWGALVSDDVDSVRERVDAVSKRFPALQRNWRHKTVKPHLSSPFAS